MSLATSTNTDLTAVLLLDNNDNSTEPVIVEEDRLLSITTFVCAVIMMVFCCFGVCGNILSIYVFTRRTMTSSINVLLTGMSVVDLSVVVLCVLVFVLRGLNTLIGSEILANINSHNACYVYPFACIAQSSSVWLLTVITVERYIAVSHPFLARHVCTSSRARLGILLVLSAALLYNIPRFLEYEIIYHNGTAAEEPWLRNDDMYYYIYFTGSFLVTHFLVPFSIITVLNTMAAVKIQQAKQQRKLLTSQQQSEHKTTSMMIIVIVMFLICNTLPFVLNLVEAVDSQIFTNSDSQFTAYLILDISNTLVVINCSCTCLIYYNFSQKYKELVRRLLCPSGSEPNSLDMITYSTHLGSMHNRAVSQKKIADRAVGNNGTMPTSREVTVDSRSTKVVANDDSVESPLLTWLSHERQVGCGRLAVNNNEETMLTSIDGL